MVCKFRIWSIFTVVSGVRLLDKYSKPGHSNYCGRTHTFKQQERNTKQTNDLDVCLLLGAVNFAWLQLLTVH